jgi:hypothetical protein
LLTQSWPSWSLVELNNMIFCRIAT